MMDLPEPLVPPEVDCTDLDGFMLNVERLMASELVALSTHEEIGAAVLLWCRAWKQRPAASLPDDDRVCAAFARLPLARFKKIKEAVLHGFVKCSDGRLYHRFLSGEAMRAYDRKAAFKRKRETEAERLRKWRNGKRETHDETHDEMMDETRFVPEGQDRDRDRDRTNILESPSSPPWPEERTAPVSPSPDEQGADRSKRGTRLSLDWTPSAKAADFAVKLGLDAGATVEKFRDYWIAQPGTKGVKLDWDATWRNWCRFEAEKPPRPTPKNSPSPTSGPTMQGEAEWDLKVRLFDPEKPWSWGAMSGPRPDQPGCYAPEAVLAKYGWRNAAHGRGDRA